VDVVFKICGAAQWERCVAEGVLPDSAVDVRDGFVHLSSRDQVAQTAALHFAGRDDLVLLAVDVAALGDALRWEPSRGGASFPHLYAPLTRAAVVHAEPLRRDHDGALRWPTWCDQPAAGGTDNTRTPEAPAKP
jgi:uncharacterized protein (DUF952 family)